MDWAVYPGLLSVFEDFPLSTRPNKNTVLTDSLGLHFPMKALCLGKVVLKKLHGFDRGTQELKTLASVIVDRRK